MFRWIFRILFLAALLIGGLVLARNPIAAWLLLSKIEGVTRLPCSVGSVEIRLGSPVIEACAVSVHNAPYSTRVPMALGVRSIAARYDPWALLRGRLVLASLNVDIAVANCVRSPEGTTNLKALHDRLLAAGGGLASLRVDDLTVRIETARYVDESRGAPRVQSVSQREKRTRHGLRGEEAVLQAVASVLAQVQSADPFETPPPAAPKSAAPPRKAKPSRDGR